MTNTAAPRAALAVPRATFQQRTIIAIVTAQPVKGE